jgi:ribosomal protein L40E
VADEKRSMDRFCTRCGARNSDDARFCTACGTMLREPSLATAVPQPPRRGLRRGGIGALALLVAGVGAWFAFERAGAPSGAELKAAGAQWLQQHQQDLLQDACLSNFNYAANPVFVNPADQNTRDWLGVLVKAGIYQEPKPVQNGFLQQLRYGWGPQAGHYLQNGRLCVSTSLDIVAVKSRPAPPLRPGEKLPANWAFAELDLKWDALPAWAQQPPVAAQLTKLGADLKRSIVLVKGPQGWALATDADVADLRARQPGASAD